VTRTFDGHGQAPDHARPSAERHGHALTNDARQINDDDGEGFGLGQAQSDTRQCRKWRAHDQQP
jgi:hypothetical protein